MRRRTWLILLVWAARSMPGRPPTCTYLRGRIRYFAGFPGPGRDLSCRRCPMIFERNSSPNTRSFSTRHTQLGRTAQCCRSVAFSSWRAVEHGPASWRGAATLALDSHLLLITDPLADEAAEVAEEPLSLVLGIGLDDRLGQHPVEVRRCYPLEHHVIDVR